MWVREGYCCHCGDCCIGSPPGEAEPVEGMCPRLIAGPEGTRLCGVHGTDHAYWNAACSQWPSDPHCITKYDRCTFTFRWVDGD